MEVAALQTEAIDSKMCFSPKSRVMSIDEAEPCGEPEPYVGLWQNAKVEAWQTVSYINQEYFDGVYKHGIDFIKPLLGQGKDVSLVEIGCGTGELIRDLGDAAHMSIGVDYNKGFIDYCEKQTSIGNKGRHDFIFSNTCDLVGLVSDRIPNSNVSFWGGSRVVACLGNTLGIMPEESRRQVYQQMVELAGSKGVVVIGLFNALWFGDACMNYYRTHPEICGKFNGANMDLDTTTLCTPNGYCTRWSSSIQAREELKNYGMEVIAFEEKGKGIFIAGRKPQTLPVAVPIPTPPVCGLTAGAKFRKSCYFDATVRWGVKDFSTYNHMLLPSNYGLGLDEYECLKNNVCLWDVAAERQLELCGPDALKLIEMMTPRPIADMKVGQCRYAIITDQDGMVLNDPVVLRIEEDKFWLSLADSDLMLWAKALVLGFSLDVRIAEAEVSPCAVQGPKSVELLTDLFGEWIGELKFFDFRKTELDGMPIVLARSGWSPERGYELYLQDDSRGDELWERLMAAGQKYGIKPGVPHQIRRIEGGLLNFGSDITDRHNVLELGLPSKWTSPNTEKDFIGKQALQRILESGGPKRKVVGIELKGSERVGAVLIRTWPVDAGELSGIGKVTSITFSPDLNANIGIATVPIEFAVPGTEVVVETPVGRRDAVIRKLPFKK